MSTDPYCLTCFITTREGGVSTGEHGSFNFSYHCGDNPEHVLANRKIITDTLKLSAHALYIPHQVHGNNIKVIDSSFRHKTHEKQDQELEGVDALITPLTNVCIGVTTADCMPLVFYSTHIPLIAVAHVGWRGSAALLIPKVIETMSGKFCCIPEDIHVKIYPYIHKESYEVGEEVIEELHKTGVDMTRACEPSATPGHFMLDLFSVNYQQLLAAGIKSDHITRQDTDTYTSDKYYSARRQGLNSGRMLTAIVMEKSISPFY